jgi:acetylglutamate kinase
VALINQHGGRAVGLNGSDAGFIKVKKLLVESETTKGEMLDIGFVGEITSIDPTLIQHLDAKDFIPVVAPIGVDEAGFAYNINADSVASELAQTMKAEKLVMMTNTQGVLDKEGKLITGLTHAQIEALFADGTIHGGMKPKIQGALDAVLHGCETVHIIDGRVEHALLLEILTSEGVGTMIRAR